MEANATPRSIGLPMLIVVFVSLCLVSFSGIAYSTARNSYEKSAGVTERTKNYYDACNQAEEMLSTLEEIPETETTYAFPFGYYMEELQVADIAAVLGIPKGTVLSRLHLARKTLSKELEGYLND